LKNDTANNSALKKTRPNNAEKAPPANPPFFTAKDPLNLIGVFVLWLISWCLPKLFWVNFCRNAGPVNKKALFSNPTENQRKIHNMLGGRPIQTTPEKLQNELAGEDIYGALTLLRDHRPGGQALETIIHGREHLDQAIQDGKGAVLWSAYFVYVPFIQKKALYQAGYETCHLSHPHHGYSKSTFGEYILNPIQTSAEKKYLKQRVVLSHNSATAAMRTLKRELKNNGIVSIMARTKTIKPVRAPFMDGHILLATGAADLAYSSGAALIPTFTVRDKDETFHVHLESPLQIDRTVNRQEASSDVIKQFTDKLEAYVLKYPNQWLGWFEI
jgi:lauroyl/myristoyl acyltransferase